MRDIQVSIADYYRSSTGFVTADDLATPVRTCMAFIQVLNDVLRKDFSKQAGYRALFDPPHDPRTELIQAFKYIRNVGQHVRHPVKPNASQVVGGIGLGYRTFASWEDVPRSVHQRLLTPTKELKVHYDAHLLGKEVTDTFLEAARFFWEICPDLVDRQSNGDWTGFPLRHQAGVSGRLHPEEPQDQTEAVTWMSARRPGGDLRVVCGCLCEPTGDMVFGLTFLGPWAFTPFFETPEQVLADLALGFPYHEGDVQTNTHWVEHLCDLSGSFPPTLRSKEATDCWVGDPIQTLRTGNEWVNFNSADFWREQLWPEQSGNQQSFLTRRERRLNAWFPIL
jgi:hypothetical protein